jgi:hypothetical protein
VSRFGSHYHVARPTGTCAATGQPLEPGATIVATLCEREDEGFDRKDFSLEAWQAGARPERLFSHWKTTVPGSDTRRSIIIDDEVLLDLLARLEDDERPSRLAFRFVLALILIRRRRLKFVGRKGEGADERWLLRPKGTPPEDPPLEVANPHLSDDDVREITAQLSEILQSEV